MTSNSAYKNLMSILFSLALRHRKYILFIFIALAFMGMMQAVFLFLVGPLLKTLLVMGGESQYIPVSSLLPASLGNLEISSMQLGKSQLLLAVPIAIVVAGLVRSLANYLFQVNQAALSLRVATEYRQGLFKGLLKKSFLETDKQSAGTWMSILMNDVLYLQMKFSEITTVMLRDSVLVLGCFAAVFVIHWPTAIVLALGAPLFAKVTGRGGKKISRYSEMWQGDLARISASVLDMRSRFNFIYAQNATNLEIDRFSRLNESYYGKIRKSILIRSSFAPMVELFGFVVFALFFYLVGRRKFGFDFSYDVMIQFFAALGMLLRPLRNLGEQFVRFGELRGGLTRGLELIDEKSFTPDLVGEKTENKAKLIVPPSQIKIDSCRLSLAGKKILSLNDLSFDLGTSVAVVGPSGVGKSFLLKLLSGLVESDVWTANIGQEELKYLTSMVSQSPFLFSDSIKNNLLYSNDLEITEDDIEKYLTQVNLWDDINSFSHGIETEYDPLNPKFSGGQIQRLVIARALLKKRPILLFDEATSAVDLTNERSLLNSVISESRSNHQLFISVTHRLHVLESFDRVLLLNDGEVLLEGPHLELLKHSEYRAFYNAELSQHEY